jgi:hypothetical protein
LNFKFYDFEKFKLIYRREMEIFKPLTILFVPTYGNELISCSKGLVDELQERGHKIVFSVDISSKEGRLSSPTIRYHLDNAQRIKENGFGLTINPYTCNKETLLCGINAMLDDQLLFRRLSPISHRMQNSNNEKYLSNLIESVINA